MLVDGNVTFDTNLLNNISVGLNWDGVGVDFDFEWIGHNEVHGDDGSFQCYKQFLQQKLIQGFSVSECFNPEEILVVLWREQSYQVCFLAIM